MKRIKCLSMFVLAMFVCVSYSNAQTKMTQKIKPKSELKAMKSEVNRTAKLDTKAESTNLSISPENAAKKAAKRAEMPKKDAPKQQVAPTLTRERQPLSEARKQQLIQSNLKAKRTKRNFNFEKRGKKIKSTN